MDAALVAQTREIAKATTGFASVEVIERQENFGLSCSIIGGVSEICGRFGRAIVLEDDVVPTPFFLGYVNDALDFYADDDRVISVGCHTFDSGFDLPETFFLDIPDCWGWGVWQRSWLSFETNGLVLLNQIRSRNAQAIFDVDGVYPYTSMLEAQVRGENQSWAIRWYAQAFLSGKLVLYPRRSVTLNIGFDGSGTHGGERSGYRGIQVIDRPISVSATAVQQCVPAREAWKLALLAMAGAPVPALVRAIKHRLRRAYRRLAPHIGKAAS
ncbi:hypothetical protein [Bradyrhizobium erythrophlei]|nr:hypothetical protein [Bradyrhizobium erythrophlei]